MAAQRITDADIAPRAAITTTSGQNRVRTGADAVLRRKEHEGRGHFAFQANKETKP